MKRILEKAAAMLLCLVLLCSALPFSASAANYSGTIGDTIQWTYNDITGKLIITGTGELPDCDVRSYWYNLCYGKAGPYIEVGEGITALGVMIFSGLNGGGVTLPNTLKTVREYAVAGCRNMQSIVFPDSVRSIGPRALENCVNLTTVHISRFTTEIGDDLLKGSDKAVICSTTEDCYAATYAAEHGYRFQVCTHDEHTHQYTGEVTKNPTCTEAGEKTFTCSVCGDSYTEPIAANGHTWEHKTDAATCTEAGSEYDLCTSCGAKQNETVIPAAGHKYSSEVTKDPTCTEAGEKTFTCSACGDSYTEPVAANGHTWEHKTDAATCTAAGAEYDLCTACGARQNETVIPAAGHKYSSEVTKDPTCTEAGEKTFTCSVCGDSYTEPVAANGHTWEHKTEAATCTEVGSEYDLCTACGAKQNETEIPAAGHKYSSEVTKNPTCTEAGEKTFTCSVCGDSYTEKIEAPGHTTEHKTEPATCTEDGSEYDLCSACGAKLNEQTISAPGHKYDSAVTKDVTCTEDGERTFTCSVCGDSYTEKIEAPGHMLEHKTESATCTEDGSEYDQCTVCGAKLNETTIPAPGHKYDSAVTKDATCTEDGERTFTCSVCGDSYTEKIEAPGHTLEHKTESTTCTEDGSEYDQCTVCGVKLNEQTISAPGHKYESTVTKDVTCTEDGERTFTCSVCGDSYTEIIEAPGHTTEHKTEPATCTADGSEYDLCTVCGAKLNEQTISAPGHKYESAVTKDATCTEDGERTFMCSVCGDSYTEKIEAPGHTTEHKTEPATCTADGSEYDQCSVCGAKLNETTIPAPGHKYDSAVTKDATCTEDGERTFTCSVCGDSYTEKIEAPGHTLEHKTEPASCTEDGREYDLCTACGERFNEKTIPAAGHKYDVTVKDATCTVDGERTFTCSVCGDSYTEKIEATGHKLEHKTDAATCTEAGAEYDLCTVCGKYFNVKPLPAAGHHFVNGVCTECGATHFWEYTVQNGGAQITAYHGDAAWLEIPSVIDGYLVTSIGAAAFAENKDLEFVFVPDSVTYIAAYAFADCVALQEICVGAHVARIDAGAFAHCPSLAIVSFFGGNLTLRTGLFADADERLMIVAPADSQTEKTARSDGLHCVGYTYPLEKDGKHVLAFNGETTLYTDLGYGYWTEFVARYADIYYLYFESLTFDGISPSILNGQEDAAAFVDMDAENLTMQSVYISVEVNGEQVTFQRLVEMLENGETNLAVTFDNGAGKKLTIWQKIGAVMTKVFNALTKLVRAIVRIFKK